MNETLKAEMISTAMAATQYLAGRCDWAETKDGAGFSAIDAGLGHALAGKSTWSEREAQTAVQILVKYKKQLSQSDAAIPGLDSLLKILADTGKIKGLVGEKPEYRLRKRDIVTGKIWLEPKDGRIWLNSGYNGDLVSRIRDLLGRKYVSDTKQNNCDACAENALSCEEIARDFGLELVKNPAWAAMAPMRKVETDGRRVLVRGVKAGDIVSGTQKLSGKPDIDEKIFDAIQMVDKTTIAFPLRSWTIRETLLWLTNIDETHPIHRQLGWAIDEIISLMSAAYAEAMKDEPENYKLASALSLDDERQAEIRSLLPPMSANRLMPHQWAAVSGLMENRQSLLADEQGLGKTIEILMSLEATQAYPAIVVAPATALLNWRNETISWLPDRNVSVLGSSIGKRDAGVPLDQADIVIVNYESFEKNASALGQIKPKALVADEAQYLKGYDSARSKDVKKFCQDFAVSRIIAATGTPVMNRPAELLTLMTLLPDFLTELGGFKRFASRYCQATKIETRWTFWWDYSGAGNLGELSNRLRETGRFIRRLKSDVLPDLPAKDRQHLKIEIANRAEYQKAREDFVEWLKTKDGPRQGTSQVKRNKRPSLDDDDSVLAEYIRDLGYSDADLDAVWLNSSDRAEAIKRMTALRQLTGIGKISAAIAMIQKSVRDEKLVVFAYHREVQEAMIAAAKADGLDPLSITGDQAAKARQDAIEKFQTDPSARLIICSLKASQTAITLTSAKRALMVELDWTPSALEQAEDRIHRISQSGQVEIVYLTATDTLDERMTALLDAKRAKINVIAGKNAPYGYRKDGSPRLQAAGPGRPALNVAERKAARQHTKASWRENNREYQLNYMKKRRAEEKVKKLKSKIAAAQREINAYEKTKKLGHAGMARELGYFGGALLWKYTDKDFQRDLAEAKAAAEKAEIKIAKFQEKLGALCL